MGLLWACTGFSFIFLVAATPLYAVVLHLVVAVYLLGKILIELRIRNGVTDVRNL
jgi:hypothetical protein